MVSRTATYYDEECAVTNVGFKAQGVELYPMSAVHFYNMIPVNAREWLVSPIDPCSFLVHFNLHPGEYNPSGYIQLSVNREFRLEYTSDWIAANNPVLLSVSAIAINFLLIQNNNAVLRFMT